MAGLTAKVPGLGWFGGKYQSKLNASSSATPKENGFPIENTSVLKSMAAGDYSQWDKSMKNPLLIYPKGIRVPDQIPSPAQVAKTTLSQHKGTGMTVASITAPAVSPLVTLGIFLPSGPRYESHKTAGASHLLKHLAFKDNVARSGLEAARELEQLGASLTVNVNREYTSIVSTCMHDHGHVVASTLLPMLVPRMREFEINDSWTETEREAHTHCPKSRLVEALHAEAFRGSGLANSQLAPEYNIHHMSHDALRSYVRSHWSTSRGVLVTMGYAPEIVPTVLRTEVTGLSKDEVHSTPASYSGGEFRQQGADATHLAVAYEGLSHSSTDLPALRVLEAILGSSVNPAQRFTTPGDGVTGALRRKVLDKHSSVHEVSAFNFNYSDTGLFGVYAKVDGDDAPAVLNAIHRLVWDSARWLNDEVVQKGKRAAALRAVRRAESRSGVVDQVGRDLLLHQKVSIPDAFWQRKAFDSVTTDDVRRVAEKLVASRPTVAAIGNVNALPKL